MTATLASAIKKQRIACGWTQRELATKLGICFQYLNDIELEHRHPTDDDFIENVAHVLDLSTDYLYFLVGKIPPDIRGLEASPEQIIQAFMAMSRVLKEGAS